MRTPGPYKIALPGGPAGQFYGLVNPQGRVVAMQIPNKDDAEFFAAAPHMELLLRRIWDDPAALAAMNVETLQALDKFILNED